MFIRTTAINKILGLNKFVKGVQGGTSAGKTYGILPVLIDIAAKNKGTEISVVAESIPHLKRGAMKDFKKIMIDTGRWVDSRFNQSDFKYRFANGSEIEFFSADNDSKLRGARRDYLYMNEANNMTFHSYTELVSRTKQGVYLDWNPTAEFWFHTELKNDIDVDYLVINYTHNEACPESALNFILKAKEKAATSTFWDNWYKVYGLGELGTLQEVIYKDWQVIDTLPNEARLIGGGLDFGYTNDPTAAILIYKYNDTYILSEAVYQTGLLNREIYEKIKDYKTFWIADSAEPKSIAELQSYGLNVKGAQKGADSVEFGIQKLQASKIYVLSSSYNLLKEKSMYCYEKDRSGNVTNKPIDSFNHGLDAVRYFAIENFNITTGKYRIR